MSTALIHTDVVVTRDVLCVYMCVRVRMCMEQASIVSVVSPTTAASGQYVTFSAKVVGLGNPVVYVPGGEHT